jgi:hypothetical protein
MKAGGQKTTVQVIEKVGERDRDRTGHPCLQSRPGKTLNALSGVAYTDNRRDFRSLKCPEVVANSPQGAARDRKLTANS